MRQEPGKEGSRWLKQSERDFDDAQYAFAGERYSLVCFLAQQAAEKAIKAFLYLSGEERVLGHSVADLLNRASSLNSVFDVVWRAGLLISIISRPAIQTGSLEACRMRRSTERMGRRL